jgi:signal transduction histidine kinase
LYLARTDALPPEPATTLVDLDDIVLDEVNRLRAHAPVQIDTGAVSAAPVRGSGGELRRLIRNLLDNAVRHARTSVRVELATVGDEVVLVVQDDGPGVPAEQSTRIFERFVRLDDARPSGQGTGLGLAIVHAIAARHGGRVALEPSVAGARLVVRLEAPA